jgi:hypothetical protein
MVSDLIGGANEFAFLWWASFLLLALIPTERLGSHLVFS